MQLSTFKMITVSAVDIHGLIQKLTQLKESILSQRSVDTELSSVIMKLLSNFKESLTHFFSQDNSELLRLQRCCFDFLIEGIRGWCY